MGKAILKRMAQIFVFLLIQAVAFFIPAGRLDWTPAWVLLGLYGCGIAVTAVVLVRKSPDLIAERARFHQEGAKTWDQGLSLTMGLLGPVATWLVAGFDVRWGASPEIPLAVQGLGVVAGGLGYALITWAMASNPFFAPVVRIQKERGHKTMSGGPYRFVRHPGYAGMMAITVVTPVILGALWAFVPAALTLLVTVVRTALEDRTLQAELAGYREYAQRVRCRLAPGLW